MKLELFGKKGVPSQLKDPFNKERIQSIHMHYYNRSWSDPGWIATIEFINGNTRGEQKFEDKDFQSLLGKMEQFVNEL